MLSDHPVFLILLSKDLDATRAFYRDTLGLEVLREDAGDDRLPLWWRDTAGHHAQYRRDRRHPDAAGLAGPGHRGRSSTSGSRRADREYSAPDPVTTDGVADMGHSWAAWFIDPSGNVLAVVQPKG
jgi:catechol 2,3-dioxygenase-like lactoylglutathione lyase family enzyme